MKNTIGIIGGGNMGSALIGGLLQQKYPMHNIWVADHRMEHCLALEKKWGVQTTIDNSKVAAVADILVLAVKPQSVRFVVASLIPVFDPNKTLLISVAAGITTSQFQRWFGLSDLGMVRAMPNTPALFAQGISGLFATAAVTASQRQMVEALLQTVGETVWIPEESLMDIVTALSGSGPGYFFYFIESLIKGAAELGLPEDIARKLTLQTALGSAYMALHSTDDLGRLREKVTSPGGTTEQGINVLKDGKLGDLLFAALQAAAAHGKSLSEQYN